MKNYRVHIFGIVQGVGFRPFIYNLAHTLCLKGYVCNTLSSVEVLLYQVSYAQLLEFLSCVKKYAPKHAKIQSITYMSVDSVAYEDFNILTQAPFAIDTNNVYPLSLEVPLDLAMCQECLQDLRDNSRFYHYAFSACTQCGARYSMLYTLPYERDNSAMKSFVMCKDCKSDYENPTNRRFHAQPISCNTCGISLNFNQQYFNTYALSEAIKALQKGRILAIKGIGGYALVARADNLNTLQILRMRKNRPHKPFAIMCKDIAQIHTFAFCGARESKLLQSPQAPIVLLQKRKRLRANTPLSKEALNLLAPNISTIGVVLPYNGIMHLLFETIDTPLVFTSANVSGTPIATSVQELPNCYDDVLSYNRVITNALDDSLVRIIAKTPRILRLSRGYAPKTQILPTTFSHTNIISFGAHQKATFCLNDSRHTLLSPYFGDLSDILTLKRYKEDIAAFLGMFRFTPTLYACDMHPQYESSQIARAYAGLLESPINLKDALCVKEHNLYYIQHHYAHFCAVLGEYGHFSQDKEYLGIIWDGTGFGSDGHIWGGESFIGNLYGAKRVVSLQEFSLLGGEKAIKDIRRLSLALLLEFAPNMVHLIKHHFSTYEFKTLCTMFEKRLNTIPTSSVGRIFDAVAYLLGACKIQSYDGQCGAVLESLCHKNLDEHYPIIWHNDLCLSLKEVIYMLCLDIQSNVQQSRIVTKFFNTLAYMALAIAQKFAPNNEVYFSGGVFANKILCEKITTLLAHYGFRTHFPIHYPSNDACISFGQSLAALAHYDRESKQTKIS